jgi:hypothetical protein
VSAKSHHGLRLNLEQLEDRTLPSSYTAATVSDLIADINAANNAGGSNTITLAAKTTFDLKAMDNTTDGPTGLPIIAAANSLAVMGNGNTLERSAARSTPAFRLFDVGSGGSLTLENLTLQNGLAFGSGVAAEGGAIYNQGTLALNAVVVHGNIAQGRAGMNGTNTNPNGTSGQNAAGGGIWSNGALTLQNGTLIEDNQAIGGNGGKAYAKAVAANGGSGGGGSGGALFEAAGTINANSSSLSANSTAGGSPGAGAGFGGSGYYGDNFGAGGHLESGTVKLTGVSVDNNTEKNLGEGFGAGLWIGSATVTVSGGTVDNNSYSGYGGGGGLWIGTGGTVTLSGVTVDNNTGNAAGQAGGLWIAGGTITLSNDIVEYNTGAHYGGGLYITGGSTTMAGNTMDYNSANEGGGLFLAGATVNMSNDHVDSNTAVTGGGLFIWNSNLTSSGDTINSNSAQGNYGGGLVVNGDNVSLSNDTVDYNTATDDGGGLSVWGGTLNMSNDLVEYNVVQGASSTSHAGDNGYGGGIAVVAEATVTLCTVTVEFNMAKGGTGTTNGTGYGGGIYISGGFPSSSLVVYLDPFTVNNAINNTDGSGLNGPTANIDGTYILQNC